MLRRRIWLGHLALALLLLWLVAQIFGGAQGLLGLWGYRAQASETQEQLASLQSQNAQLLGDIQRLRDPVDFDFLEARVRAVLGYVRSDERVLLLEKDK